MKWTSLKKEKVRSLRPDKKENNLKSIITQIKLKYQKFEDWIFNNDELEIVSIGISLVAIFYILAHLCIAIF